MSRLEAEKRLRWQDAGVFLVRESESAPGEFSVSVRSVNTPQSKKTERSHTDLMLHVHILDFSKFLFSHSSLKATVQLSQCLVLT